MKPAQFEYLAPVTVPEAVAALAAAGACPLAGGQSLIPLLSQRAVTPSLLVDLRLVEGLGGIAWGDGEVTIGAMVRQRHLEHDERIARDVPLLSRALRQIAHPQVRSQGTLGGSIAHADPGAELPAVLLALDGTVSVQKQGAQRTVAARDLFVGPFATALDPGELITAINLPVAPPHTGAACGEVAVRANVALAGAVAQLTVGPDERVQEARLALFGVSDRPLRASAAEQALVGRRPDDTVLREASSHVDASVNGSAPSAYRSQLAGVVARRALAQAVKELW